MTNTGKASPVVTISEWTISAAAPETITAVIIAVMAQPETLVNPIDNSRCKRRSLPPQHVYHAEKMNHTETSAGRVNPPNSIVNEGCRHVKKMGSQIPGHAVFVTIGGVFLECLARFLQHEFRSIWKTHLRDEFQFCDFLLLIKQYFALLQSSRPLPFELLDLLLINRDEPSRIKVPPSAATVFWTAPTCCPVLRFL